MGVLFSAHATHFMGGQITYKCLGGNSYKFTLKLYQDCNGCDPLTMGCQGFTLPFGGGLGTMLDINPPLPGFITELTMDFVVHTDITVLCDSTIISQCESAASTFPFGVREFVYEATISIPSFPATIYTFSHESVMRNGAITTLVNPAATPWYIQTTVDPTVSPCNSSPEFLNNPTGLICRDEPYAYNHNAFDADGDSLVYTMVDCKFEKDSSVNFMPGYSGTAPISSTVPITINQITGEITFTPDKVEIAVMCVLVEEFRNGVKISEVVRDMQISVQNCDNSVPQVRPLSSSGGGSSSNDTTIFPGSNFCIPFKATDADFADPDKNKITMTVTSGIIPPAVWNFAGPQNVTAQGTLCWTPSCSDIRSQPYIVTVIAQDNNCPIPGIAVATFEIYVIDPIPISPELKCVSVVNNDTDLRLTWGLPLFTDTLTIDKYYIYRATNTPSGFTLIDSVNKTLTNYTETDPSLNLIDNVYFYYITGGAVCNISESIPLDTVSSIRLRSDFGPPDTLTLNWNPLTSTFTPTYKILRFNGQSSVLFDLTTDTLYIDSITNCTPKYLDHTIEVSHPDGTCISQSNTVKDTVPGVDFPLAPTLCKTEVNLDNSVTISYQADIASVNNYYIYRNDPLGGGFTMIDSVMDPTQLFYIDLSVDASQDSFLYLIDLRDTCLHYSPKSDTHGTINLEGNSLQLSADLSWNNYFGWVPDFYEIYRGVSFPLSIIGQTTDTSYADDAVTCSQTYYYRIKAVKAGGTFCDSAWSDTMSLTPFDTIIPLPPGICNITVAPNFTDVIIEYVNSPSNDADSVVLASPNPDLILLVDEGSTPGLVTYIDPGALLGELDYRCYYTYSIDSCGNVSDESPIFCTMDLQVQSGVRRNFLKWNPFTLWTPDRYNIYGGTSLPLELVGVSKLPRYTHNNLEACEQVYYYQIEAERDDTVECISSFSDSAMVYCSDFSLPNVFTPNGDGINDFFVPIITSNVVSMDFKVFNRWGHLVYETIDPMLNWDGTDLKGKVLTNGVYYYVARVGLKSQDDVWGETFTSWVQIIGR